MSERELELRKPSLHRPSFPFTRSSGVSVWVPSDAQAFGLSATAAIVLAGIVCWAGGELGCLDG